MRDDAFIEPFEARHGRYGHQPQTHLADGRPRCRAKVWGEWSHSQCSKAGKHEEAGYHWCGIHLPSRRRAKQEKRDRKWEEEWARKNRGWARTERRDQVQIDAHALLHRLTATWTDGMVVGPNSEEAAEARRIIDEMRAIEVEAEKDKET